MSINPHLSALELKRVLRRYTPEHGKSSIRALFFTAQVDKEVTSPQSNVNYHRARADIERVMERWVLGQKIIVSMSGGGTGAVLARLDAPPPDVWELRITDPTPQFRILGQFAEKDVFIATAIHNRSILRARHRSNNARSQEWKDAMHECAASFKSMFEAVPPLTGNDVTDFISENYHVL